MRRSILLLFLSLSCRLVLAQNAQADTAFLSEVKTALRAVWPKNRSVNLVFHGHSVPAGYWHNHEVHSLESYPHLALVQLNKRYPYVPINVIVTAIGGENAEQGAKRMQEVLNHKADVLFIDYALNDRGIGLDRARQAWEDIIRQAQAINIKVILLTPSPDQRVDIMEANNDLEKHAMQVRELAVKYHTGLIDSFKLFQEKIRSGAKLESYMSHVNHPNKKGHELIAAAILKWF